MEETTNPASEGADASGSRFGRAKEFVNDKYAGASEKVRDTYSAARERVEDVDFGAMTDQLRSYVRSNPGKALLLSVGVGFLIGLLLRSDDDND